MSDLRTIQIDFDLHKLIEAERRGFGETPNEVLRRLLKLGPPSPSHASLKPIVRGRAWSDEGVVLAHGTKVRMSYNGRTHEGEIVDGKWVVEGKSFSSPSGAASGTAITKRGKKTRLDGWKYWEVKLVGEDSWKPLDSRGPPVTYTDKTVEELSF